MDRYVQTRREFDAIPRPPPLSQYLRYSRLVQQIRFHEIRTLVLTSNNLPHDFMVSDYLDRCQTNTIISLVELRATTWFLLLIGLELYFYLATLEYWSDYPPADFLSNFSVTSLVFFEAACVLALCGGLMIKVKMDKIFWELLHDPEMIDTPRNPDMHSLSRYQIDLFWRSKPSLIIDIYEKMSVIFAFLLSLLIIFGKDLDVLVPAISFTVSYIISLISVLYFMPRYTLCVSVGQLIDRGTLHETLSEYI